MGHCYFTIRKTAEMPGYREVPGDSYRSQSHLGISFYGRLVTMSEKNVDVEQVEERQDFYTLSNEVDEELDYVRGVLHLLIAVIDDKDVRLKVFVESSSTVTIFNEAADKLEKAQKMLELMFEEVKAGRGLHGETGGAV